MVLFIAIFLPKDWVGYLCGRFRPPFMVYHFRCVSEWAGSIHLLSSLCSGKSYRWFALHPIGHPMWIRILNLKNLPTLLVRLSFIFHTRSPKTTNTPICRLYVVHSYRNYLSLRNLRFQFSPELVALGNASCFCFLTLNTIASFSQKDRNSFNPCLILCTYIVVSFSC